MIVITVTMLTNDEIFAIDGFDDYENDEEATTNSSLSVSKQAQV